MWSKRVHLVISQCREFASVSVSRRNEGKELNHVQTHKPMRHKGREAVDLFQGVITKSVTRKLTTLLSVTSVRERECYNNVQSHAVQPNVDQTDIKLTQSSPHFQRYQIYLADY